MSVQLSAVRPCILATCGQSMQPEVEESSTLAVLPVLHLLLLAAMRLFAAAELHLALHAATCSMSGAAGATWPSRPKAAMQIKLPAQEHGVREPALCDKAAPWCQPRGP